MKKSFHIKGMSCAGCASSVERALNHTDGVNEVNINLATDKAVINYDEDQVSPDQLASAVKKAGYDLVIPKGEDVVLQISGMHCSGCTNTVEKSLNSVDGVNSASVNLSTEQAFINFDSDKATEQKLKETVEKAGYRVNGKNSSKKNKLSEKRELEQEKLKKAKKQMSVSWIITLPLMIWMFLEMVLGIELTSHTVMEMVMTAGAALVILIPGKETLAGAWRSSKNLNPNMDVLIAIGTLASLATGLMALGYHLELTEVMIYSFAGIAAMIMAFHLTGRYIETKAKGRASDAITKLLTLEVDRARIVRNSKETEIDISQLRKGDVMIIRPGEKIPSDGVITEGKSSVNEAMVTGESMPVLKSIGDKVIGGTINTEGYIRVRATEVGEDTFLNRVVKLVEEAQGSKIPIQDFADKITVVFVPVILVIAALTFFSWWAFPSFFAPILQFGDQLFPWIISDLPVVSQAFYAMLAVLVIACPCALGLATPTALMVGSGLGAENGILIRRGEAIQRLQDVTTIVFDKTGTLTHGKPEVTDVVLLNNTDRDIIPKAAVLENFSEHPIGKAITNYSSNGSANESHQVKNFRSHTGSGVEGVIDGEHVAAGNRRLMDQLSVRISDEAEKKADKLIQGGKSVVYISVDNLLKALIGIQDTLKEDATHALKEMEHLGYKTMMITGDQQHVAGLIADRLGITEVAAEIKPDNKSTIIKNLQQRGEVVAMVGDGVNDAPALSQADVGIALGTGMDIAIESGSIILINGDLQGVVQAISLSRQTMRKIRQNLFWAFFYNIIMIPAAVAGWMHPVLAEAAMAVSSISVVTNSKLLGRKSLTNHAKK